MSNQMNDRELLAYWRDCVEIIEEHLVELKEALDDDDTMTAAYCWKNIETRAEFARIEYKEE